MHTLLKHYRDNGAVPRFHGNGFIQLQIAPDTRIHLWHADFPMMPNQNAYIHDHVWPLWSRVLLGRLTNRTYRLCSGIAAQGKGVDAYYVGNDGPQDTPYDLDAPIFKTGEQRLYEGSAYYLPRFALHSSHRMDQNPVMTIMRKGVVEGNAKATIICPNGEKPYDAFQPETVFPEESLWGCLDNVFRALPWPTLDLIRSPDFHDVGPPL